MTDKTKDTIRPTAHDLTVELDKQELHWREVMRKGEALKMQAESALEGVRRMRGVQ